MKEISPQRHPCWRLFHLDGLYQLVVAIFICLSSQKAGSTALKLRHLNVPGYAITGETASLECNYDLGREALYVVKWFKGTEEFYRYMPGQPKSTQTFPLAGVQVDVASSNDKRVVLRNISLKSAGKYRCEVSADAPSFHTIRDSAYMNVYDLPDSDPVLSGTGMGGLLYTLSVGEWVIFNCTSYGSFPAANLSWQVNGQPVDHTMTVIDYPVVEEKTGTFTTTKHLKFIARPRHVKDGEIRVKCISKMSAPGSPNLYYKSTVKNLLAPAELKRPFHNLAVGDNNRSSKRGSTNCLITFTAIISIFVSFCFCAPRH